MAAPKPTAELRSAGGIQYELYRKKIKQLHLRVRDNGRQRVMAKSARDNANLPDKEAALAYFTAMSDQVYPAFARVLGGQKPAIKVRSMTSRWGVCVPARKQITFALQLYNQPPAAQIYVVVHEYCHFLQPNHSPAFWAEVEKLLPDWKARRELLKH